MSDVMDRLRDNLDNAQLEARDKIDEEFNDLWNEIEQEIDSLEDALAEAEDKRDEVIEDHDDLEVELAECTRENEALESRVTHAELRVDTLERKVVELEAKGGER